MHLKSIIFTFNELLARNEDVLVTVFAFRLEHLLQSEMNISRWYIALPNAARDNNQGCTVLVLGVGDILSPSHRSCSLCRNTFSSWRHGIEFHAREVLHYSSCSYRLNGHHHFLTSLCLVCHSYALIFLQSSEKVDTLLMVHALQNLIYAHKKYIYSLFVLRYRPRYLCR